MAEASHAVFLSYASQDAEAAQKICEALRAAGIEVFLDQSELRGGDAWDQKIRREIHDCVLFIPIVSQHTQERLEGYFRHEWKLAIERTHHMAEQKAFLVPVVVDGTQAKEAFVPDAFREVQWTHLPAGETPPEFVTRIRKLLSGESGPVPMIAQGPSSRRSSRLKPVVLAATVVVLATIAAYLLLEKPWIGNPLSFAPPPNSIAVLPFVNMSGDKGQDYFSDGMTEELLNSLARINELQVAARTSSFAFKNKAENVSTIARGLHVAYVLEGSVRKVGDHVRITAQLIRADSGYHLWSDTYDRTLDDVFRLQDQIAGAVIQALKVKLLGGSLPAREAPGNQEAYDLYLQSRFSAGSYTREGYKQALDYLDRALKLDPGYEPLWTELSIVYVDMAAHGFMPDAEALPKARDAVRQAIALNPKSARAHIALGYLHMNDDWDWTAADREISEAFALEPGSADVLHAAGNLYLVLGRVNDSVRMFLAAVARDPLRASSYSNLGVAYFADGRLAEAEEAFRKSIQLRSNAGYTHNGLGLVLLWKSDLNGALEEMKRETDETWRLEGEALVYSAMHRRAESDAALAELTDKFRKESPYVIATVYGYRGEANEAFTWLNRALAERDGTLPSIKGDPLFATVRSDPRYASLLQKVGLPL